MGNTLAAITKGTSIGIRKLRGRTVTINSQDIEVLDRDDTSTGYVRYCSGTVTITDGGAGYAVGCIYVKTNGSAGTVLYINEGTTSSCDFNPVETPSAVITGVTADTGLVGGGAAGTVTVSRGLSVRNETGGTLVKGTLVRISGYSAGQNLPLIVTADANTAAGQATYVLTADITNNSNGTAYGVAIVTNINTDAAAAVGDPLYLSETAGAFTPTAPTSVDAFAQKVGIVVTKNATTGSALFFPEFGIRDVVGRNEIRDGSITPSKESQFGTLTSTADGTGTGAMNVDTKHYVVTSASATNQISLPGSSNSLIGKVFTLWVGANGFELITPASSNATINNVDSDGTNQADIGANTLSRLTLVNTNTWILENLSNLGAVNTAIIPDND